MRRLGAIALVLAGLAACSPTIPPIGAPAQMVHYRGQTYPMRVVPRDPVASGNTAGGLSMQVATVRIVAPDRDTAAGVHDSVCPGTAGDKPLGFDRTTGEWVFRGGCG